ncbi:MAG: hypothetical protein ACK40G_06385 [Cytophagaceae bacterium]
MKVRERRNKSRLFGYFAGLVIVAGLIFFVYNRFFTSADPQQQPIQVNEEVFKKPEREFNSQASGNVGLFVEYVNRSSPQGKGNIYTVEGLIRLSAALEQIVHERFPEDNELKERARYFSEEVSRIQTNPHPLNDPGKYKEVFLSGAELIEGIQTRKFPYLKAEIHQLYSMIDSLHEESSISGQKNTVEKIFDHTASVVETIDKTPS